MENRYLIFEYDDEGVGVVVHGMVKSEQEVVKVSKRILRKLNEVSVCTKIYYAKLKNLTIDNLNYINGSLPDITYESETIYYPIFTEDRINFLIETSINLEELNEVDVELEDEYMCDNIDIDKYEELRSKLDNKRNEICKCK